MNELSRDHAAHAAGKFKYRPAIFDAAPVDDLFRAARGDWFSLPVWLAEAYEKGGIIFAENPSRIEINTPEHRSTGLRGDWIIRGATGNIYSCNADIFAATFEPCRQADVPFTPPSEPRAPDAVVQVYRLSDTPTSPGGYVVINPADLGPEMTGFDVGDVLTIHVEQMTQAELDAMPEWDGF